MESKGIASFIGGSRYLYCVAAMIILCLYVALTASTPFYLDDFNFMAIWREQAGSMEFSWSGLRDFYSYIRENDNGRFANVLSPITTSFSPLKELFPLINGLFYVSLIVMVQLLSGGKAFRPDNLMLPIAWASVIAFLPWRDYILVFDYTLNYLWSAVMSLLVIYMLLKGESHGWRIGNFILALLVVLVSGGMHEGFSASTLCGLALLILCRKFRISRQFYILFAVYFLISVLVGISPGVLSRFNYAMGMYHYKPEKSTVLVVAVWIMAVGLSLISKPGRKMLLRIFQTDIFIVCFGVFLSGYLIGYFTLNEPRCYFYANLGVVIMLLQIIGEIRSRFVASGHTLIAGETLCGVVMVLCCLHTLGVIHWQKKFGEEAREIYAKMASSEPGEIFEEGRLIHHKFQNPAPMPKWLLDIPLSSSKIWGNEFQIFYLGKYYKTKFYLTTESQNNVEPEGKHRKTSDAG